MQPEKVALRYTPSCTLSSSFTSVGVGYPGPEPWRGMCRLDLPAQAHISWQRSCEHPKDS